MAIKRDRRTQGRKEANIRGTLTRGRDIVSCHVIEISDSGARIELGNEFMTVEGKVRLAAAAIGDIEGEVVWQKGTLVGLKLYRQKAPLRTPRA